ncbi:type 2 lanthipeptide synthetase LanM family protein [Lentzea sp. NPDC051213]|uniref:type 2 lanthipeptide synthetase LanM family protein n=1 Tax=Lentzea sp. NPDC051213 TaxID=3364126 RepID=UPI003797FDE2
MLLNDEPHPAYFPDELAGEFGPALVPLIEPALAGLAAELTEVPGLDDQEREVVHRATAVTLRETVYRKVCRVLVLELNAARITGALTAPDPAARFAQWLAGATDTRFWEALDEHYPRLRQRLSTVIGNRCAAAVGLAHRFSTDRAALAGLLGPESNTEPGALTAVEFGAGDSHRGGQTVAILTCAAGRVVYKPRSVAVDAVLGRLLAALLPDEPARIRVPEVLERDGYGWAAHVGHRYCSGDGELRAFYRGMGHWLAVMRLLGGSDLHAENLIAAGPVPVVVDCETLFTPVHELGRPSGYGQAVDRAVSLVGGTVLRTGLLPGRGLALGWRGVDSSAIGSLPGQQPSAPVPMVVDGGTDLARVELVQAPIALAANHPSADPMLGRHWQRIYEGFTELSERLLEIDREGGLEPLLAGFADRPVRVVARATEAYAELGRMLWHPTSLHDEPAARLRAAGLLAKQAETAPGAPGDPEVIDAEIADLLDGDVPFFATTPRDGVLTGPGGTTWGKPVDLVADALERWRRNDLVLDRQVAEAALVSAYLNEGWLPDDRRLLATTVNTDDLDRRRRTLAADIVHAVQDHALRAEDGSVTWIAPVLNPTGWAVTPLGPDLYGGLTGIAVLLAAYQIEVNGGRADEVDGLDSLLAAVVHTMRLGEDQLARERAATAAMRPEPPGGYVGLGSQIWGWLLLHRFGVTEGLERAAALAAQVADGARVDESFDLLHGMAGAVVPLLRLAEATEDVRWTALACQIGDRLIGAATADGCWPTASFPEGIGGFAHGATGIGWVLARLAAVTGEDSYRRGADSAFAYEESLYDPALGGWRDLRSPDMAASAWCHGAGGIGIVAVDLGQRDVLRRAAAVCWESGLGWNHTLCHGDLGAWEVIDAALAAGVGPVDRVTLDAHVLSSLEEYGPISGMAREAFSPGLLPGLGGVAYQLLRMHPDCTLPSVLLPDPGPIRR